MLIREYIYYYNIYEFCGQCIWPDIFRSAVLQNFTKFCNKSDGFCAITDGFHIESDGFHIESDGFCTENDGLCTENHGFCTENDELCTKYDEFHTINVKWSLYRIQHCGRRLFACAWLFQMYVFIPRMNDFILKVMVSYWKWWFYTKEMMILY